MMSDEYSHYKSNRKGNTLAQDDFNTFMSVSSVSSLRRIERSKNIRDREFEAPFRLKLALVKDLVDHSSVLFDET